MSKGSQSYKNGKNWEKGLLVAKGQVWGAVVRKQLQKKQGEKEAEFAWGGVEMRSSQAGQKKNSTGPKTSAPPQGGGPVACQEKKGENTTPSGWE